MFEHFSSVLFMTELCWQPRHILRTVRAMTSIKLKPYCCTLVEPIVWASSTSHLVLLPRQSDFDDHKSEPRTTSKYSQTRLDQFYSSHTHVCMRSVETEEGEGEDRHRDLPLPVRGVVAVDKGMATLTERVNALRRGGVWEGGAHGRGLSWQQQDEQERQDRHQRSDCAKGTHHRVSEFLF